MVDISTGITSIGQDHKSRVQNQRDAFHRMVEKLKQHYIDQEEKQQPGRSSDINRTTRTYHEPDDRVTDHVTGEKYSYWHTVGKNDISEIIEDRRKYMNGKNKEEV
jgi:protein subunit release factor A